MSATERVVVVGGGVIGAACAYYLRQAGRDVTLIDQGEFGRGCSHGNCGYVCPSHVLPLAGPGALWGTLKTLLARNSPLKVRMRFDPAMWRWFWQFARKCNQRDMLAAGHAIQSLLTSSRNLYDELLQSTLADVEWEPLGLLFVFRSQSGLKHYEETDKLLRGEFDLGATRYDEQSLLQLEPALKPGSAGAWHYETDGHLRPDKLMRAWRAVLERGGVEIREHCELRDLITDRRQAKRLSTSQGELAADQVVIATGAWTPQLHRLLLRPIAIQPGKGYSITMPRPEICPRHSMIFEEHRVAVTPLASSYRIGSTMEFAGYDSSMNPDRINLLKQGAEIYLRQPLAEPILETWAGWRPMTPDSLPFLGPVPSFDNVFLAAGHGMLGVSMSPSTGKLIAELVTSQTPHIDPQPYAVDRRL
ncbi:D-amino acid dehydrogenase small subunit [Anatilimnocola aggregata]|uniref:D-amino acid dehydrogenase small subunit n=1 Tax=Anatilimnocola aggregata TaxID=2528021 RepID=A0A517YK52_9BACT|nr:FAD-dependent oxidoreductase [Anatilimnocola aggregata]QDU30609.1 D-amino acid dehydrogenase small subunit [Anatilimnocola aggregata]